MKMNRSGNTLVTVLVVSTLILGGVVISMQYVGLTNTSSTTALRNSSVGADDLIALNILSGKLRMTKDGSEWGVEPYPIGSELALSTFKPYIKNFSTATTSLVPNLRAEGEKTASGECRTLAAPSDRVNSVFLDTDCKRTHFDLDDSRLGSLETGADILGWNTLLASRNQTERQKGFVGYPKHSQLSGEDFKKILNGTTATFATGEIKAKAVTFYKLGYDPSEPRILSSLEVALGDTGAIIPFPAPPDPTCKITTEIVPSETRQTPECNGDCIELSSGRGVRTQLFADSIVGSFKLSADSFRTFSPSSAVVPDSNRQSIQTIRKFSPTFPTEVPIRMAWYQMLLKPPADLYLVQGARIWPNDDEHGTWTVAGQVAGLQRDPKTATCERDFQVYPPPPPHCVASVANGNILKGESTVVTLNCNNPQSGNVIRAGIMNGNRFPVDSFAPSQRGAANYKVARASYTRTTDYQIETINIAVTGLGGSINVSTLLGAVCPHNDPNYVSYIQGWGLPSAPLRRAAGYIGPWFVTQAANVWNPGNSDLRWRSGRQYTADSVNHFNMASWVTYNGGLGYWVAYGPKRSPSCSITQVGVRWSGCFTSDTRIRMADGREKLVSKISENDLIWNPLYQSPVRVIKVVKGPEKKALYQLRVAKNRLVVTEDHPFLTQRGWVRADELDTKDLIMGEGLGKQILSVKKLSYKKPVDVFNFELDTDIAEGHMVMANGIPTGDLTTQLAIKQNRKNIP